MARYNTVQTSASISGASTVSAPTQGYIQSITGTAPFNVTVPDPRLYPGIEQVYFNNTSGSGIVTLVTPTGQFNGAGSSGSANQTFPTGTTITLISDGTNYIVINEDGGPLIATSGTFSGTLQANGQLNGASTVSLNPSNANVTISPTGSGTVTVSPGTAGTINNMSIGASTPGSGGFTTLSASGGFSLTSTTATHTISSTSAASAYNIGGALQIAGGLGIAGAVYCNSTITATALSGPLTGTIQTASQPNITTLGGLTSVGSPFSVAGTVSPSATNSYDLGTSSLRWRVIYTQDLELSNGIGDYTIVEGPDDLFLYNNKQGKVYKFALIQVDPSEATPKIKKL